jgi:hypothetical protein
VFDAGLASAGPLVTTQITGNTFVNVGFAALASYWGISWVNNQVIDNQVSSTPYLGQFFYDGNSAPFDTVTVIAFEGNQFDGSTLVNPSAVPPAQVGRANVFLSIDFSSVNEGGKPLSLPLSIGDDTIANTVLPATKAAFYLVPASAFVDGGGNVCASPGNALSCASAPSGSQVGVAPMVAHGGVSGHPRLREFGWAARGRRFPVVRVPLVGNGSR